MTKASYVEYLQSEEWEARANRYRREHPEEGCFVCPLTQEKHLEIYGQQMHVDHRNHKRWGEGKELDEDLRLLCKRCHEFKHKWNTALPKPKFEGKEEGYASGYADAEAQGRELLKEHCQELAEMMKQAWSCWAADIRRIGEMREMCKIQRYGLRER